MAQVLISVFGLLIGLGLFFVFPVRNTVSSRGRLWTTWGLIVANIVAWCWMSLTGGFISPLGFPGWAEQALFTGDFGQPQSLFGSLFVHSNPLQLLVSLWVFYLIAPILEDRLKSLWLAVLYFGGGIVAVSVYGAIGNAAGANVVVAGLTAPLGVVLGFYLALYPFQRFVFCYNFLIFSFSGAFKASTFALALVTIVLEAVSPIVGRALHIEMLSPAAEIGPLASAALLLVGLAMGFIAAALRFGLSAFVVQRAEREGEPSLSERLVERALSHTTKESPAAASARRPTHALPSRTPSALGDDAPAEELEAFAEQCLQDQQDEMLATAYERFRARFPDRSLGPALQAAVAQRFEQVGRSDLAIDAFRLLVQSHKDSPAAAEARLRLARLLSPDLSAAEEAIGLLGDFLRSNPSPAAASQARQMLDDLIAAAHLGETYRGLSHHKEFRFSKAGPLADARGSEPLLAPPGAPTRRGEPVERSAEDFLLETAALERIAPQAEAPPPESPPPASVEDILPDPRGQTLAQWGVSPAGAADVARAMAEARTYAVILLPAENKSAEAILDGLARFWDRETSEALAQLRQCRAVLLDDAPSGRAVAVAHKLGKIGLPAAIVPLLHEIVYTAVEEVYEFSWTDSLAENASVRGATTFAWDQVRLVSVGQVAAAGAVGTDQLWRPALDVFVAQPHCWLRFWADTIDFANSGLDGQIGSADSLQALIEYLDRRASGALKTPSFQAVAKVSGQPVEFLAVSELDNYNRWFLYAGFGKYAAPAAGSQKLEVRSWKSEVRSGGQ